ncbi:copper resistance CopC family protein [Micromonospora sp. KLBMP9576]|uniref:copper resistance CopC family protein n=1 Tax=Micromonospora sp. KLBMP9576 TaxID=3424769 RepID=UPI003D92A15C
MTVAALVTFLALFARFTAEPSAGTASETLSITPADNAVLAGPPSAVEIRVSGQPDLDRSHIAVRGSSPDPLTTGPLTPVGADGLRQNLTVPGPDEFVIAYHVVMVDGRDVSGIARFTVGAPGDRQPPSPPATHAHGVDRVGAALLIVDGVALLAVLALLVRRPERVRRNPF